MLPIVSRPTTAAVLGFHGKRQHGGGVDEECAGAGVDGLEQDPEQHHAADVDQTHGILKTEHSDIKNEKYQRRRGHRATRVLRWRDSVLDR